MSQSWNNVRISSFLYRQSFMPMKLESCKTRKDVVFQIIFPFQDQVLTIRTVNMNLIQKAP